MKRIYFSLFLLFLVTQANAKKKLRSNRKSTLKQNKTMANHLNLTFETAFIFDPKDAYHDIALIKSLRHFLQSLENQITNRTSLRSQPAEKNFRLNDYVYELGRFLLSYSEEDLHTFTIVFQDVIEDYYSTQQFQKLFFDPRLRTFVKNSIKIWTDMDPKDIRHKLREMFSQPTYNESFTKFTYTISQFYSEDEGQTLYKMVNKFQKFPEKQTSLKRNIEKSLKFIVFDKFKNLNIDQRTVLVKELGHLADYVNLRFSNISTVVDEEEMGMKRAADHDKDELGKNKKQKKPRVLPRKESPEQLSESDREEFPSPNDSLDESPTSKSPHDKHSRSKPQMLTGHKRIITLG